MSELLTKILYGINSIINNYGWSMVVFTVIVKALLLPLDFKSRKSMSRMTALQPEMQRLQKKYANDRDKLNQKTAELYRTAGVSPMSGCLPMLLSMVVLWFMWSAMRAVANTELAKQCIELLTTGTQTNESWLWIKNLWMPDSPFHPVIPNQSSLAMMTPDVWQNVFAGLAEAEKTALAALGIDAATISSETILTALQALPNYAQETALWATMPRLNLILVNLEIFAKNNGWFILPVLAAVTQYLMTLTQPQPAAAEGQAASTNKFMMYFFPIFSLWICSSYNALFSLYWVVSNLLAWVQSIVINKVLANSAETEKKSVKEGSLK